MKTWRGLLCFTGFICNSLLLPEKSSPAFYRHAATRLENQNPYTTIQAIPLPAGFSRVQADSSTFGDWLRHIPLKKNKTVYLYNGQQKTNQQAQFAVLDIPVGNKDLQQCADAVIRLRAEYLYATRQFEKIVFTDNAGQSYIFSSPYNRTHFDNYLQVVFGMCGSASLSRQLKKISIQEMQSGDVFVHGGFPGHAEIVVDMAKNKEGKSIYLLAQSYMPAQDIHILVNETQPALSPWYSLNGDALIATPEYTFSKNELKRW